MGVTGFMELITAAMTRLDRIYHYQPFDADRLSKIVLDRELYFSNPKDFNDPWDCRPWYSVEGLTDPAVFERHIDWYLMVTRAHLPDMPEDEIQRMANVYRANPNLLIGKIQEISSTIEMPIFDRYRVYCLSSKPDDELMWAHYSNKHQGLCLEFDVRTELFCSALKVSYQEKYPSLDLTDDTELGNLQPFITKSAAWSYEDEYRLIAQEEGASFPEDTLKTRNNIVGLPEGALTTIIVGCMAPDSIREAVKTIIASSKNSIDLKLASRAPDQYKLSIG